VAILLPQCFSMRSTTVRMEGRGFIVRVDEEQEGVAVEFSTCFDNLTSGRSGSSRKGAVQETRATYMPAVEARIVR